MRILLDFITLQYSAGGGNEYIRRVYDELFNYIKSKNNIEVCGIIDSALPQSMYEDYSFENISNIASCIFDIRSHNITDIVKDNNINRIFIGVAQYWGNIKDLQNITCEVIVVIHDLFEEELEKIHLFEMINLGNPKQLLRFKYWKLKDWVKRGLKKKEKIISNIIELIQNNNKTICIAVSGYTKYSLICNYNISPDKIHVLYSPERLLQSSGIPENKDLEELIYSNCHYYLMVSANRVTKNAAKVLDAFKIFVDRNRNLCKNTNIKIVTLGLDAKEFENHIALPFLSESDLVLAIQHCYALIYPSWFEGFGYPPMEAMKFGKPVLASNVTSIPEILGDAAIYFSPLYETDVFRAISLLSDANYNQFVELSKQRYKIISEKQNKDLHTLVKLIIK